MQNSITAYLLDASSIYIEQVQLDPMGAIPDASTFVPPPVLKDGEFAQWTGVTWLVLDAAPESGRDIHIMKEVKNEEIDGMRAAANASAFPFGGKLIACDALSRSDLDGVVGHIALFNAFPAGFPGAWKATDKTMLPLPDVDAFRAMYAAMTEQGTRNFNHSQELKAQLAAASTQEEIAAIQW